MSMPGPDPTMGPIQVSISFDPPPAHPVPDATGSVPPRTDGRAAGPVSGSVTGAGNAPVRFDGWLELLAILETAVDGTPADQQRAS